MRGHAQDCRRGNSIADSDTMIVNDFYKFIFIHVPKCGGSSISECLKSLRGNNRRLPNRRTKHETLNEFLREAENRLLLFPKIRTQKLPRYFSFGFVRNPWDRAASLYTYLKEKRPRPEIDAISSFSEFLKGFDQGTRWIAELHSMRPQKDFFSDSTGHPAANFIGRFESLTDDFQAVQKRLGFSLELPHTNKSSNSVRDFRNDYTDEMAEIVARRFADDISLFGYRFETGAPSGPWKFTGSSFE
jgi:hypothetical protein